MTVFESLMNERFSQGEREMINDAFRYYDSEFIFGRDGNVYRLTDLCAINNLPGKIDENGIIVPI